MLRDINRANVFIKSDGPPRIMLAYKRWKIDSAWFELNAFQEISVDHHYMELEYPEMVAASLPIISYDASPKTIKC